MSELFDTLSFQESPESDLNNPTQSTQPRFQPNASTSTRRTPLRSSLSSGFDSFTSTSSRSRNSILSSNYASSSTTVDSGSSVSRRRRKDVNAAPSVYWLNSPSPNLLNLNKQQQQSSTNTTNNTTGESPLCSQAFKNHLLKLNQAETASSGSGSGGVRKSSGNGNGSPEIVSKRNKKSRSTGLVDQIETARVEGKSKGKGKQRQSATSTLTTTTLDQDREKDKEMESPTKKSRSNPKGSQDLDDKSDSRRVKEKNSGGSSSSNNINSSNPNREANNKSSNSSINRSISFHNDHSSSSSSTSSTSNLNSNHKRIKRTSSSPTKLRGRFKRSRTSNSNSIPGGSKTRRTSLRNDGDMSLDGDHGEDVGNRSSSGSGSGNGGEELVMKLLADLNEQLNSFGEVSSQEDQAPDQDQVGALETKHNGFCGSQQGKLLTESQEIQMKEIETIPKVQVQSSENKKARDADRGKENSSQPLIPQITSEHSPKKSHSLSSNRQFGRTTSLPSKGNSSRSNNNQVQLNSSSTITNTSEQEQSKAQLEIKSKKEGIVRKLPLQTIRSENDVFNSSPIRRNGDNKNVKKSPKIERLKNRGNDGENGNDSDEFDLSLDLDFETQMELDRLEMVGESQKLKLGSQKLDDQIQVLGGEKIEVDDDDDEEKEEEVQVVKEKGKEKEKEKEIEMEIEKVDQLKEETSKEIVSDATAAASNEETSTKVEKNSNPQVPQSTSPSKIKSSTSSSISNKTTINRKASVQTSTSNVQTSTSNPTASKSSQPQPISGKVIYSRKSPLPPRTNSNSNKDKEKGPKTGLNKAFKPPRRVGPVQNLNASGNSNPKERSNSNVSSSSNNQRRVSGSGNGNGSNTNLKMKGGSGSSISKPIVLDDDEEEGKEINSRKSPRLNRKQNEKLEKSDESFDFDDGVGDEEVEKIFMEQGC